MAPYAMADWRAAGACVTADPDLFFPVSGRGASAAQADRAKRVCVGCQVRSQCLAFALRTRSAKGIWGGTTPEERSRIRRNETARQRAARVTAA